MAHDEHTCLFILIITNALLLSPPSSIERLRKRVRIGRGTNQATRKVSSVFTRLPSALCSQQPVKSTRVLVIVTCLLAHCRLLSTQIHLSLSFSYTEPRWMVVNFQAGWWWWSHNPLCILVNLLIFFWKINETRLTGDGSYEQELLQEMLSSSS